MAVKVAINGFGRIGRLAFRQMFGAEGYEVVAINDLTTPSMLAHLLKYDSSQGRYVAIGEEDQVTADDEAGTITVKGKTIKIYKEPDANNCPWGEIGVDMKKLLIKLIRMYQSTPLSSHRQCVFIPTCSEYMITSINEFGVIKGIYSGIKRILRCHPFGKFGYDPVITEGEKI